MAYTTINKSSEHFNTKLYTGNNSNNHSITGVGFAPDMVWQKRRDGVNSHVLFDKVRGATKYVHPDGTSAEITSNAGQDTISLDSDGFTLGVSTQAGGINQGSCVSWNWKANGAGSINYNGSINSTVSANTTNGFSIVSFTGTGSAATVGHGLGAVPKMYIVKNRSTGSTQWRVYHASLGATKFMCLDATQAVGTASSVFNNTEPTSSVFSVGTDDAANKSGDSLIAYCFADVQGYSKFGSYTGNGNADGSFIYTGFSPAFVMIKETTGTGKWVMKDNRRTGINVNQSTIYANESEAEGTPGYELIDLLSNGFKQRGTGSYVNGSGQSYIYMAFAEEPLVGDNPATAR